MRKATLDEIFPDHRSGYWGKDAGSRDVDARVIRNSDVLPSGAIRWDEVPTRGVTKKEMTNAEVRAGDLLITTSGDCGRVSIASDIDSPTIASNFVRLLRVDSECADPRFLWHQMRTGRFRAALEPFIRGTTIDNLSVGPAFASVELVLPPLEEQRRIAAVLDAADALRTRRREALAKLDTLTQTMFAKAQSTELLGRPVRLAELAERVTVGHVGPASESFVEHGVPFIRTGDILRGRLDLSATRFVSESFHAANQKSRLQPGDVVITRVVSNELRAAVVPETVIEANCGDVVVVRPGRALDGAYLVGLLHQPRSQAELLGRRVGSSHLKVNTKVLQNWQIRLPSADGLANLAAQLDSASVLRKQFESSLFRLESLLASLQQRAFRGQL